VEYCINIPGKEIGKIRRDSNEYWDSLFDMLMWLFGPTKNMKLHVRETNRMGGYLELANADVERFLSLDRRIFQIQPVRTSEHFVLFPYMEMKSNSVQWGVYRSSYTSV
jgi:hypothetical protein